MRLSALPDRADIPAVVMAQPERRLRNFVEKNQKSNANTAGGQSPNTAGGGTHRPACFFAPAAREKKGRTLNGGRVGAWRDHQTSTPTHTPATAAAPSAAAQLQPLHHKKETLPPPLQRQAAASRVNPGLALHIQPYVAVDI